MDSAGTALRSLVDSRDTPRVGRQARLELVFASRGGRTVLDHAYAEPPLRVGRWFQHGDGVHMILTSSAPGTFGGDCFEQQITVERGARVRLTSQSALQVHPSPGQEAAQLLASYDIGEDAELTCEWDPMIPFAEARLDQRISFNLAGTGRLLWSDALMAGRAAAHLPTGTADGERWAFSELAHELIVRRTGSLEYLERYRLRPEEQPLDSVWRGAMATHFGTIFMSGWPVEQSAIATLYEQLARDEAVHAVADHLGERLAIVRLMSAAGARFRDARDRAATSLRA